MRFTSFTAIASLPLVAFAQSSSSAPAGGSATASGASIPAASSASAPATQTSGFLSSAFPSITGGITQTNPSNNVISVSNGVTLTDAGTTNTMMNSPKTTGEAASSSSSPGAAAPTAGSGALVGGVVGLAAVGIAALL